MCFVEFIGYTCGHTSVPLNRACPMTTQLHSNPCCPCPATRPFLASEMCPACARILHGRWVQILEMEHRFMHERGACGCEVRFPALQQPRLVSAVGNQGEGAENSVGYNNVVPPTTSVAPFHDNSGTSQVPPLYQETQGEGTAAVSVRLPSLYAAEWTADHAKLHENGKCNCRVHFQTYQSPMIEEYDNDLEREIREELENNARNMANIAVGNGMQRHVPPPVADPVPQDLYAPSAPSHQQYRTTYPQASNPLNHSAYPELRSPFVPSPSQGSGSSGYAHHNPAHAHASSSQTGNAAQPEPAYHGQPSHPPGAPYYDDHHHHRQQQQYSNSYNPELTGGGASASHGMGQPARWACSPPDLYPLDAALGPADGGAAAAAAAHPVDLQPMSIQWANGGQVPLTGLPIGAGAEGDAHTPPFAGCALSREARAAHLRQQLAGRGGDAATATATATIDAEEDDHDDEDEGGGGLEDDDDESDGGYEAGLWARWDKSGPRRSRSTHF